MRKVLAQQARTGELAQTSGQYRGFAQTKHLQWLVRAMHELASGGPCQRSDMRCGQRGKQGVCRNGSPDQMKRKERKLRGKFSRQLLHADTHVKERDQFSRHTCTLARPWRRRTDMLGHGNLDRPQANIASTYEREQALLARIRARPELCAAREYRALADQRRSHVGLQDHARHARRGRIPMWGKAREHLLGKSNLFETNTLMHPCSKKGRALKQTLKMRISSPARGQPQFSGDLWVSQGKALAFFTQET